MAWAVATALIILPFFLRALLWSSGAGWPRDPDLLRNAALAQAIFDGHYGGDPHYAGEVTWYPPLVPWAIAMASKASGVPLIAISAKWGAWFNLVAVLMATFTIRLMLGRGIALACLAGWMVLLDAGLNTYAEVGLSPFLDPINAMYGFFCIGLFCIARLANANPRWWVYPVAGGVAGLTFLGHPSSSMVLGGTFARVLWFRWQCEGEPWSWTRRIARSLLFFVPLLASAMVILQPLWVRYGLHMQNRRFAWIYPDIWLSEVLWAVLRTPTIPLLIAAGGIITTVRRRSNTDVVLLAAFGVASLLFLWSSVSSAFYLVGTETRFPMLVVPPYHFWYHLKLLLAVFFGIGLHSLTCWLVARAGTRIDVRRGCCTMASQVARAIRLWPGSGWATAGVAVLLYTVIAYRTANDPALEYNGIRGDRPDPTSVAAYHYIMAHTRPEDVFLTSDRIALWLVSATGRKLVSIHPLFSNPYVDADSRAADRDRMFAALREADMEAFRTLALSYGVSYMIITSDERISPVGFELVYRIGTLSIYRVHFG